MTKAISGYKKGSSAGIVWVEIWTWLDTGAFWQILWKLFNTDIQPNLRWHFFLSFQIIIIKKWLKWCTRGQHILASWQKNKKNKLLYPWCNLLPAPTACMCITDVSVSAVFAAWAAISLFYYTISLILMFKIDPIFKVLLCKGMNQTWRWKGPNKHKKK